MKCPACNGSGWGPETEEGLQPVCEECNGAGEVSDEVDPYESRMRFLAAAERQAAALERIAAVLESLVSAAGNLKVEQP